MALNFTTVQGRLVADPELKTTTSGVSVANFRVAWSEKYKEVETKLFLNCTAWRSTADFVCKYFSKGKPIVVEGKLYTKEYNDRDGNKRTSTELTVEQAHFAEGKASKDDGHNIDGPSYQTPSEGKFEEVSVEEDFPF